MNCPHCSSANTKQLPRRTALGYQVFRCRSCQCTFNERSDTPFNFLEYPTDIVLLVVLWRLRYRLTLRDLAEMFLEQGLQFTHEAVREWEERFAPLVVEKLRTQRRGKAGISWYVDEVYIRVGGRWCYLYRAIDREGDLVDSLLSERRDLQAAKRFFKRALAVVGHRPRRVTTDGYEAYPQAIEEESGEEGTHRTNQYLNNRIEQDHRGIKQRYRSMRGFKCFKSASRFCTAFDELRNYLRARRQMGEQVPLAEERETHLERVCVLKAMLQAG
jgi:putative transposase